MNTSANEKMREALIKLRDQARTNIRARGADVVGAGWVIDVCEAALSTVHTQEVSGEAVAMATCPMCGGRGFFDNLDECKSCSGSGCKVNPLDPSYNPLSAIQSQADTPPAEREGWKLVPVEPTIAMVEAAELDSGCLLLADDIADAYSAMLSAAPKAPQQAGTPPAEREGWKPTHAEVLAWNDRNGGWFQGRLDEARCAIDDARSMHQLSATPQQQEQSGEAKPVAWGKWVKGQYCLEPLSTFIVHDALDLGWSPLYTSPSTPTATASQESAPGQEAVAIVKRSTDGKSGPVIWISSIPPDDSLLYLAPPTSTASAAMVIKQAAEALRELARVNVALTPREALAKARDVVLSASPANAEAELEALMMKVAVGVYSEHPKKPDQTLDEWFRAIVRRVLDEMKGK